MRSLILFPIRPPGTLSARRVRPQRLIALLEGHTHQVLQALIERALAAQMFGIQVVRVALDVGAVYLQADEDAHAWLINQPEVAHLVDEDAKVLLLDVAARTRLGPRPTLEGASPQVQMSQGQNTRV